MDYVPPFTLTSKAVNLIAEISAKIERYAIRMEQPDALMLRKANRIKTIHSSLAIEGNTLTESEVADIISGVVIYLCAFSMLFKKKIAKLVVRKPKGKEGKA